MPTSGTAERAEITQQADSLRREIAEDLKETQKKIDDALFPLSLAVKRGVPGDWLIKETGRRWDSATRSPVRICFDGPREVGAGYSFEEIRPTPSTFVIGAKALKLAGMIWEPGFTVCSISVYLERRTITRKVQPIIELSMSALCDRACEGELILGSSLGDLGEYRAWAPVLLQMEPRSAIVLPTSAGFWRGFTAEMGLRPLYSMPFIVLHGWSSDAEVTDLETKDLLEQFRLSGWSSTSALGLIRQLTRRIVSPS